MTMSKPIPSDIIDNGNVYNDNIDNAVADNVVTPSDNVGNGNVENSNVDNVDEPHLTRSKQEFPGALLASSPEIQTCGGIVFVSILSVNFDFSCEKFFFPFCGLIWIYLLSFVFYR